MTVCFTLNKNPLDNLSFRRYNTTMQTVFECFNSIVCNEDLYTNLVEEDVHAYRQATEEFKDYVSENFSVAAVQDAYNTIEFGDNEWINLYKTLLGEVLNAHKI